MGFRVRVLRTETGLVRCCCVSSDRAAGGWRERRCYLFEILPFHFGTPNSILEEIQGPLAPPVSEQVSERVADDLWLLLPNHCVVPSCSDREAPTSLKTRRDPQRKSRIN